MSEDQKSLVRVMLKIDKRLHRELGMYGLELGLKRTELYTYALYFVVQYNDLFYDFVLNRHPYDWLIEPEIDFRFV